MANNLNMEVSLQTNLFLVKTVLNCLTASLVLLIAARRTLLTLDMFGPTEQLQSPTFSAKGKTQDIGPYQEKDCESDCVPTCGGAVQTQLSDSLRRRMYIYNV